MDLAIWTESNAYTHTQFLAYLSLGKLKTAKLSKINVTIINRVNQHTVNKKIMDKIDGTRKETYSSNIVI